MDIYTVNKLALDFVVQSIPRMQKLAEPLKHLGIIGFGYLRTYDDCRYLKLFNGYAEYTEKFFETIKKPDPHFIKALQNTSHDKPMLLLWPNKTTNISPILSLHQSYDICHGFQISYRKAGYCEKFHFNFDKLSDDKSSFYMQNLPILLKFIDYFRQQAADLLDDRDKNKIAIYQQKFDTNYILKNNTKLFLDHINNSFMLKNKNGDLISLTKRETECLKLYVQNKTAKEVSNLLGLSPRTVEFYLQQIKHKLDINYKSELVEATSNHNKFL